MIDLSVVKKADKNFVFGGSGAVIRYSIIITNRGTTEANSVKITDLLGQGECFVQDTIMINGEKQNITGLDKGVDIGVISKGCNTVLSFDVSLEIDNMINQVENQAIVSYCDEQGNTQEIISNKIIVPIVKLEVGTNKTTDKQDVRIGEVVTFTITIDNKGNDVLNNVRLYDILPQELSLMPGTVTVNSVTKNTLLNGSIILDVLQEHSSVSISFKARVISYPLGGVIKNKVYIYYKYTFIINEVVYTSIGESCARPYNMNVINEII